MERASGQEMICRLRIIQYPEERMKFRMEPSGTGPLGRWFFSALLLSVGLLVLVQLSLPSALQIRCLLFQWTGIPCPTCGATRCLQQVFAGEFLSALRMQSLVFMAALPGGLILLCCSVAEVFRWPIVKVQFERSWEKAAVLGGLALAGALNWLYLIFRG